jgi:hypothetical protein
MTLFDFRLLTGNEQIKLLYAYGVYVGKRRVKGQVVVLYQLEDFYVEIYYKKYRHYVSSIHSFCSTALLNPYLDQINIEDLIKCMS